MTSRWGSLDTRKPWNWSTSRLRKVWVL